MGLLGGMARTAVVAGTATAVSNRVSRRQARRWGAQDQQAYEDQGGEQQQDAEPEPEPAGTDMSSKLDQIKQLGDLKAQGLVTDAEFQQQKTRILNS